MIKTEPNINLLSLEGDYIFVETARAIREHEKKNPTRRIIKLGIGDCCRNRRESYRLSAGMRQFFTQGENLGVLRTARNFILSG